MSSQTKFIVVKLKLPTICLNRYSTVDIEYDELPPDRILSRREMHGRKGDEANAMRLRLE